MIRSFVHLNKYSGTPTMGLLHLLWWSVLGEKASWATSLPLRPALWYLSRSVIFGEYSKCNKDDSKHPLRVFLGQYYEEHKNIQHDHGLKEFTVIHCRRQEKIEIKI